MSEENVSKLRLKPKLAVEPEVPVPQPGASPVVPTQPAPVPLEEAKTIRLKPKLSVAPAETISPSPDREVVRDAVPFPPPPSDFVPPVVTSTPPESEKAASRFTLKPKAPAETQTPVFPPPPPEVFDAPIPAPVFVDPEETAQPTPAPVVRTVTARPFPPPPANFPPPPSSGTRPAPPWAHSGVRTAPPKKKTALIVGGAIAALLVLGGGFIAYKKFTAAPPPPPVPAKSPSLPALVEQAKQQVAAPIAEILPEAPAAQVNPPPVKTVDTEVVPPPAPAPVVVEPPPPPASAAFKAWVDNLRIVGVRPGATPRVMIGNSSYLVGDVVNPQLGITFEGYNADTRKLTFKDKTGAKIDRRN